MAVWFLHSQYNWVIKVTKSTRPWNTWSNHFIHLNNQSNQLHSDTINCSVTIHYDGRKQNKTNWPCFGQFSKATQRRLPSKCWLLVSTPFVVQMHFPYSDYLVILNFPSVCLQLAPRHWFLSALLSSTYPVSDRFFLKQLVLHFFSLHSFYILTYYAFLENLFSSVSFFSATFIWAFQFALLLFESINSNRTLIQIIFKI